VLIPLDPKSAMQAAKLGQPLAKSTKSSKITGPLMQLLTLTLEQASEEDSHGGAKSAGSSLLGKFNFKALVAKKPKEAPAQAA
jgi:pilus assembly protein CpaE